MNTKIINVLAFSIGVGVGSIATWKILKNKMEEKYERIVQEEINSVKETFSKQYAEEAGKNEEREIVEDDDSDKKDLDIIIKRSGYRGVTDNSVKTPYHKPLTENRTKKGDQMKNDKIYVIPPENFDEVGYKTESLIYYADKVLTTDDDEIIENIDDIVGSDSLNHFGEYEDDSVFVRNDILKTDYEILSDNRRFSDISAKRRSFLNEDDE